MDKLSELSNPVAWKFKEYVWSDIYGYMWRESLGSEEPEGVWEKDIRPIYSQEYVSTLERKIAELEQAMRHIHGALLDITVPRVAIAKAAELAVEHASMKEQSNG